MKYYNKKKIGRSNWPTAPAPSIYLIPEAKSWCQRHESPNRFYFHYTNTRWWFESKDDAVAFALVWGKNLG